MNKKNKRNIDLSNTEKVALLIGKNCWETQDFNGKLPKIVMSDGPVGLRHPNTKDGWTGDIIPSVAYPSSQILSMTWNKECFKDIGNAIANDCIDNNVDILLGPGVNIKRIPQNGRNFEYYSEDPFLAGDIARIYIKAVQDNHVGTSLKHFFGNNTEIERKWCSSNIDEQTIRDIYLKPFKMALESKPWTVMCSYNLLNGVRMSENKQYFDIIRNEFNFENLIISDWDAVQDFCKSINAGIDITMPYDKKIFEQGIKGLEEDKIDLNILNESSKRVINLINKNEMEKTKRIRSLSLEKRNRIAQKIAAEGICLLKNTGVLPIINNKTILISGAPARYYFYGGGSSEVTPNEKYKSLRDCLSELGEKCFYSESIWDCHGEQSCLGNLSACVDEASKCDYTIMTVGDDNFCEVEGRNRTHIRLSYEQEFAIRELSKKSKHLIVVIYAGSAIDMTNWINDVDAVIYAGYCGQRGNEALANILLGKINPSGKLTETFAKHFEDYPANLIENDAKNINYYEKNKVGYRYFWQHQRKVLFPFGFGLSYSSFIYKNLRVEQRNCELVVEYDIFNNSNFDGKEVSEIYLRYKNNCIDLIGYDKSLIKANSTKSIKVVIPFTNFEKWDIENKQYINRKGKYTLFVGAKSQDFPLKTHIFIK